MIMDNDFYNFYDIYEENCNKIKQIKQENDFLKQENEKLKKILRKIELTIGII